jgi:hypothetical protein
MKSTIYCSFSTKDILLILIAIVFRNHSGNRWNAPGRVLLCLEGDRMTDIDEKNELHLSINAVSPIQNLVGNSVAVSHCPVVESEEKTAESDPKLSRGEFESALRSALRFLDRPEALLNNPLLDSRIVAENTLGVDAKPKQRALVLQRLIRETTSGLQGHPKRARGYRALLYTYLRPATTQERAAEILDLPFSTYRRHLAEGIALLTETLWLQETGEMLK